METSSNKTTLNAYENNVDKYVGGTPQEVSGFVKEWLDRAIEDLNSDSSIIEIGSAFGRDAQYLENKGLKVERTDATQAFVNLLNDQGYKATNFNPLEQDFDRAYDLIFANAVLLHFTREEAELALEKMFDALSPGGKIAITLKKGDGEAWSEAKVDTPRFFCYWQEDQIIKLLEKIGYKNIDLLNGDDERAEHQDQKWIRLVAYKD